MTIFAITCLILILFILPQLLNWMWRNTDSDEDIIITAVAASLISAFILYQTLYYIIKWTYPLLN